ncbi:fatty acid desaturase CarF family protein [Allopontixanthobacter sp.]|uniref:fatty acid desaturase CarF family protein n=1 Tax=Allopontixanthobacter sp. TaxID=2906452 RepID=UPI002ABA5DE9|nr:fatty acid desaturase CarF family protein [Allopontixanthobacter sp.]MDZ4307558.1 fatty acid desaturase CarF family protein [Allopontixanthobacter sp.]
MGPAQDAALAGGGLVVIAVSLLSLFLQLLLGWLLADFLSGVLHWVEDRFGPGREHWPLIGRLIFAPNLLHHVDPTAFTRAGFLDRNWTTWAVVAPLACALLWLFGSHPWIWAAAAGGAAANEVHAWAHRRTLAPGWATVLQRAGFIQSPAHHAVHHVPPYLRSYCILTDWLNPLLDRTRFWRRLERLVPESWLA